MRISTVAVVIFIFVVVVNSSTDVPLAESSMDGDHFRLIRSANLSTLGQTLISALPNLRSPMTGEALVKDLKFYADQPPGKIVCETERCLGCLQALTLGINARMNNLWFVRDVWELRRLLSLDSIDYRRFCEWYDNKLNESCFEAYEPSLGKGPLFDHLSSGERSVPCAAPLPIWDLNLKRAEGDFLKIECFRRGSKLSEYSNLLRFCDECWGLRVLPSDSVPSVFAEIQCQENAKSHMGGHGKCFQTYTAMTVAKVKNSHDWATANVVFGAGCLYAMSQNSILHGLIGELSTETARLPAHHAFK